MSLASLLLAAVSGVLLAGCAAQPTSRILGGDQAGAQAFPFIVSIRLDMTHVCGGSIVGSRFILTAAHCVSQSADIPVASSRVSIRAGSVNQYTGGTLYSVANIYINSGYETLLSDVAVLELTADLQLTDKVQIIPLAESDEALDAGGSVAMAGWGTDDDDGVYAYKLHFQSAEVLSESECDEVIGYGKPSTLCLQTPAQAGSCFGDGGGPAVHNGVLVGVSNFVIGTCGTVFPDVFARVSYFSGWINSIISAA